MCHVPALNITNLTLNCSKKLYIISALYALLLLLQQLRSLPNGQNAVSSDPTSILPLCSPPDFCPLLPADSANANKVTATVSSPNQRSSTFEHHQQTPPATLCDFVSVSSGSSCSSSFESSLGESKTFSAGGTRNASGAATAHRLSYPREFKLLVLKSFLANGQNKYRTCKEFQITKSMLNGWLQKADRIRRSRPGSLKSGRSGRSPTDELWQDEEQWRSIAWEICATNDRLPIQAFYDRFPKVLQQTGAGTGRRERNGAKSAH
uniref:Transposase n=1 Tax=Globodera pallida TaxID=36090 RepID=A0A183CC08_GLOPA